MKHIDGRAILHIAGERRIGEMQKCVRCKCIMNRDLKGFGWRPGASVACFGHGSWSKLMDDGGFYDAPSLGLYRPCKAKGREAIDLEKWEAMGGKA